MASIDDDNINVPTSEMLAGLGLCCAIALAITI
jgi:hypothetical protein